MTVVEAQPEDIPQWLSLAAEVEFLFGLMVDDPGFRRMLERNVQRGTALCVREADGPAGAPLMGALLYSSSSAPHYHISWLVVAERWRRQGVGEQLVRHVFDLVRPPAEIAVVTFGPENAAGLPARRFYERLGFTAAEAAPDGPEGGSRQVFRRGI